MTCANLRLYVGQSTVRLGSGDVLGYTEMNVDVDTGNGLDYYPFDTYTVSGEVDVSKAVHAGATYRPAVEYLLQAHCCMRCPCRNPVPPACLLSALLPAC
jgi:hypothetical protein